MTQDHTGEKVSTRIWDAIILGGGAAGLMAAITAAKRGKSVLVLDHAKKPAEKIRISGGGRCNFTNLDIKPKNFLSSNPRFCISALKRYTQHDFIKWVESHNIAYHEKTLGQLFCNESAQQIIDMLLTELRDAGGQLRLGAEVREVIKEEQRFIVTSTKGVEMAHAVIVATGGKSIPKMGATGIGYELARQFGLNVLPTRAALVPFTFSEQQKLWSVPLAGVAVDAQVKIGKTAFREGLLFTHRGLSGPSILQISSYWQEGVAVTIDLAPDVNVLETLQQARKEHPKQDISNALSYIVPKKLAKAIAARDGLGGHMAVQSDKILRRIEDNLHRWQITPMGTEGYRTAEVTLGGVDTKDLSSQTMEANEVPGLYFIGEVVDVTGHLGGYNFQWAWSSGHAAGMAL
ncbi:MAG: NAD(P)/FAD-dependent oxidoreductase [Cohaesibacter sp.]|jgi:predicted Rossmann fold flavoprotein|nr:NAD(P)/FAD-dependent oxidoreductase [Cohaesibacter sp.]